MTFWIKKSFVLDEGSPNWNHAKMTKILNSFEVLRIEEGILLVYLSIQLNLKYKLYLELEFDIYFFEIFSSYSHATKLL